MKPLLVDAKQIRELLGLTVKTLMYVEGFPKPVHLSQNYGFGTCQVTRNLWKLTDIEKWVKKLEHK